MCNFLHVISITEKIQKQNTKFKEKLCQSTKKERNTIIPIKT